MNTLKKNKSDFLKHLSEGVCSAVLVDADEGVKEQEELGLAVHGGVVGVVWISHPGGFILIYEYFDFFLLLGTGMSVHRHQVQVKSSQI